MKKLIFILLLFNLFTVQAQTFLNNSFEASSNTPLGVAENWSFTIATPIGVETHRLTNEIFAVRDSSHSYSGKFSLMLSVSDTNNFFFAAVQNLNLNNYTAKTIRIVAWIKTKECKAGAGLNCTQLNSFGKNIGYTSSKQQEVLVTHTNDWSKTELVVLLNPESKSLKFQAFLYGAGTVWFDHMYIEDFSDGSNKTAPLVTEYVDTLIKIVKENSLYASAINWPLLTKQLDTLVSGMQTYREASQLSYYILSELRKHGDNHSLYFSPTAAKQFGNGDIWGRGRQVVAKYLGYGIGYVSMPGFASLNDSVCVAFASNTQAMIKKIDTENNICGWIVDLRDDDGGSISPMIAGLGPILGEGIYAQDFEYSTIGDTGISFYRNGESYFVLNGKKDSISTKVLHPYKLKKENIPVAVLIGKGCGSSGEGTAAAFIGRRNTKLFGQPTAGYTTGNAEFTLPGGGLLFIAAGIQTDRNGKKYPERIFPDLHVKESVNGKTDLTLVKAKKWLLLENRKQTFAQEKSH